MKILKAGNILTESVDNCSCEREIIYTLRIKR